ncbi:hypothetical protein LTR53_020096, partial [Teratosphaeriaceae sp. CCFEE 6253]
LRPGPRGRVEHRHRAVRAAGRQHAVGRAGAAAVRVPRLRHLAARQRAGRRALAQDPRHGVESRARHAEHRTGGALHAGGCAPASLGHAREPGDDGGRHGGESAGPRDADDGQHAHRLQRA